MGVRNKFPLTIDQFRNLHFTQGKSLGEISRSHNINISWISTWCKRNGIIPITHPTSKLSEITLAQLQVDVAAGLSSRQIAKKYGISKSRAHQKLAKHNLIRTTADIKIARNGSLANLQIISEFNKSKNDIDPAGISIGSSSKIWWICRLGHEWEATVKDRTREDRPSGCPQCTGLASYDEDILYQFLVELGFVVQRRVKGLLSNPKLELDLYLPDQKLAIELCGQYWHSESRIGAKSYYNKYVQARDAQIRLLTIFDSELHNRRDVVLSHLRAILGRLDTTIFARKCSVVDITQHEANIFLDKYHMQGTTSAIIHVGLIYESELVAVMSFRKHTNNIWELARFCSKGNISIPGAASKLLSYFSSKISGIQEIISFSDNRYSEGALYKTLGFVECIQVSPSYWYFRVGRRELYHKFRFRKDAISSKLGSLLPGETEYQAMLRFGYDRIWDCGKKKWTKHINRYDDLV